jgi:hypothetical protein
LTGRPLLLASLPAMSHARIYEHPYQVGDEVHVTGTLTMRNTVGGTTLLRHGGTRCKIVEPGGATKSGSHTNTSTVCP